MIRKNDLIRLAALALMAGSAPALADTLTHTPLGIAGNASRLAFAQGVLDFTQTPYPVAYTYTLEKNQVVAPNVTIVDSIADASRSASISVSPGIIKARSSSSGIIPGMFVQNAVAAGTFVDTFSILSSDPSVEWVPVTFRIFVDGTTSGSGGSPFYNHAGVNGIFELTTALGGQQDGSLKAVNDFQNFPTIVNLPCETLSVQVTCGLSHYIASNNALSFDGLEFIYQAVVRPNQIFTLQAGIAAGTASLSPSEFAVSDFSNTAIFGGIQVGQGFSVSSLGKGGLLDLQNGVANYDTAFAALTAKYGVATPGVPEPGSWALMLAGFVLAGSALRRRPTRLSFA